MSDSPLAEANPESLQELFDKDPLQLTDPDIDRVVAELRTMRERWALTEKKGKAPPKKGLATGLSLDDLEIKL
jgi:hypothetical protein